ncbi:hypothetical protein V1477_004579 [Vespula maculifrons]|uniref:Uncharacterized protein n=1 Tax=Vespula maculifrons TaxID=7453 RepID=A0ABD2CN48_VESMC
MHFSYLPIQNRRSHKAVVFKPINLLRSLKIEFSSIKLGRKAMPLPLIDTSLRVCAEFISIWFPEVGKSFSNVTVILTLPLKSD